MRVDSTTPVNDFAAQRVEEPPPTQKDEFLRLLVAQLENQNPLDPQSGAEFVAQLSQFAMVEQSAEANERLAGIQAEQGAQSKSILVGFVGKEATFSTEAIALDGGGPTNLDFSVDLDEAATTSELAVLNEAGDVVATIEIGPRSPGKVDFSWDGTGTNGTVLEEGTYRLELRAKNKEGADISGRVVLRGVIDSLSFEDGGTMMRIGNALLTPASVLTIG